MSAIFKVLVVEDNAATSTALQNALNRLGCQVISSSSSDEAIQELQKGQFDAVFAELCVRENGGRSVARFVKNQNLPSKCFIITGWKGDLEPGLLKNDGIHDIIRKPLIFKEIRDKVLEHFG
jgi:CheY-like chemotaxis protein